MALAWTVLTSFLVIGAAAFRVLSDDSPLNPCDCLNCCEESGYMCISM
jgi:hypothetical protein